MKTCNLSLLSIPETEENGLKRPTPLSESYTGNTKKTGFFLLTHIFSFFEPVSAALLLLEMVAIVPGLRFSSRLF